MRTKAPKAPTLTNALDALKVAMTAVTDGVSDLLAAIESKDHKQALAAFKQAHDYLLVGKDMLNHIYPHLSELRPKPEPKPARQSKKDRERFGLSTEERESIPAKAPKEDKSDGKTNRRDMSKAERRSRTFDDAVHSKSKAEPAMTEADPDAP